MTCSDWQDRFSEIYEGRGDQALEAAFGEHLRRCAACRAAYAEFELAWHALDSLAQAEPAELPPGFHASLLVRIEREQIDRAVARRKALRVWLSDLFRGPRSLRTTVAYAAVAVCIALGIMLIPNPLGKSVARLLGFGPETGVIKTTQPQGQRAGPTVDKAPKAPEEPANEAMPQGDELSARVEIGWGASARTGRSIVTLTNHGTRPLSVALELLAGISPSPLSTSPDSQAAPGPRWNVELPPSKPVDMEMPPVLHHDALAVHLKVQWDQGGKTACRYLFLPTQRDGGAGEAAGIPRPDATLDYVLGCIAAKSGLLIVSDRRFEQPSPPVGQEVASEDALWRRILPPGCSFRHDKEKKIVYIEGNEP